ncbi:MAG: acetate/propionate family kinase [Burkholderiaceae bacterium]|nr:acetate/propionate family kinase [Burkholderiaceae bacterium]
MSDVVLVLDAGSSSVKFGVFTVPASRDVELARLVHGRIEGIGVAPRFFAVAAGGERLAQHELANAVAHVDHQAALSHALEWLVPHLSGHRLAAVGHRIVHGGSLFAEPVRVTASVLSQLEALVPLAPLHQPHGIAGIRALAERLPDVPQIACFDTAFHRTQPAVAQLFGLPRELSGEGIRRYGFHGLSYQHIASQLPMYLGAHSDGRVIVAHLGNGASLCALRGRRSVASTMGFTALDGLLMGTRCGSLDPGVVLYLIDAKRMTTAQVAELLYERSGLLGVSGVSSDLRVLLASDKPAAARAIDLFVYRIVRELGSLVAALGGLDALVLTAGIGENSAIIRRRVCNEIGWLGLRLDPAANEANGPRISTADSPVSAWVIATNEELVIAHSVLDELSRQRTCMRSE